MRTGPGDALGLYKSKCVRRQVGQLRKTDGQELKLNIRNGPTVQTTETSNERSYTSILDMQLGDMCALQGHEEKGQWLSHADVAYDLTESDSASENLRTIVDVFGVSTPGLIVSKVCLAISY